MQETKGMVVLKHDMVSEIPNWQIAAAQLESQLSSSA